jgi:hypothetical protein
VTGNATFTPVALSVISGGPGFSLKASATTTNPTADLARAANTQVRFLPARWWRGSTVWLFLSSEQWCFTCTRQIIMKHLTDLT